MNYVKREIDKELYDKAKDGNLPADELFDIPDAWKFGYGYYGYGVKEENGKYYVYHTIGSTCD